MRLRRTAPRWATALPEMAITVTVFLSLMLGALDLGIAVFRLHVVTQAARQGARQAIVHGKTAPSGWNGGTWGPATYGPVAANSADPKAQAIAPYLTGMDLSAVQVTYQWPDNDNAVEKRVQVTVTTTWTPILAFIFGTSSTTISGSSTMLIAH
jgi:Flp pilus assembly protein TadG